MCCHCAWRTTASHALSHSRESACFSMNRTTSASLRILIVLSHYEMDPEAGQGGSTDLSFWRWTMRRLGERSGRGDARATVSLRRMRRRPAPAEARPSSAEAALAPAEAPLAPADGSLASA